MAQSMVLLVIMIQEELQQGALSDFLPFFELVGSIAEGTRIGLANELDLGVKFQALMDQVPFKVDKEDPFTLKKARLSVAILDDFFLEGKFLYHKFLHFLLDAVERAVCNIFKEKRNPFTLMFVTTNDDWNKGNTPCNGECRKKLEQNNFTQCELCTVMVSQTKSGVALQFVFRENPWSDEIYCSIDLIPMFPIEEIPTMELTCLINTSMLGINPPRGWLNYMFKYPKEYKIIEMLVKSGTGKVISVGLKTINFLDGRNYHIKPAQEFTEAKFSSRRMRRIYSYIKFLKKVLDLDLSSYWVKKELLKPQYKAILDSWTTGISLKYEYSGDEIYIDKDDKALVRILAQPEFKMKVESKIDIQQSLQRGFIQLIGCEDE